MNSQSKRGKRWSEEDKNLLIQNVYKNVPMIEIAKQLQRTEYGCKLKIKEMLIHLYNQNKNLLYLEQQLGIDYKGNILDVIINIESRILAYKDKDINSISNIINVPIVDINIVINLDLLSEITILTLHKKCLKLTYGNNKCSKCCMNSTFLWCDNNIEFCLLCIYNHLFIGSSNVSFCDMLTSIRNKLNIKLEIKFDDNVIDNKKISKDENKLKNENKNEVKDDKRSKEELLNQIIIGKEKFNKSIDKVNTKNKNELILIVDKLNELLGLMEIKPKYTKQKISKTLRTQVWDKFIGIKIGLIKCPNCKVYDISQSNFECGHVFPESKGGKIVLDNLRPICSDCNKSNGIKEMDIKLWEGIKTS